MRDHTSSGSSSMCNAMSDVMKCFRRYGPLDLILGHFSVNDLAPKIRLACKHFAALVKLPPYAWVHSTDDKFPHPHAKTLYVKAAEATIQTYLAGLATERPDVEKLVVSPLDPNEIFKLTGTLNSAVVLSLGGFKKLSSVSLTKFFISDCYMWNIPSSLTHLSLNDCYIPFYNFPRCLQRAFPNLETLELVAKTGDRVKMIKTFSSDSVGMLLDMSEKRHCFYKFRFDLKNALSQHNFRSVLSSFKMESSEAT